MAGLRAETNGFGHVGLFPEQAENWDWLAAQVANAAQRLGRPLKVLNLFAYTGGATLAAAAAGREVTHVDAARNIVAWARRNAELSGLAEAPIRWIAEDAVKFVRRENPAAAIATTPRCSIRPATATGRGEPWQLDRDLPELLAGCAELTAPALQFVLLTCHTPGYVPDRLRSCSPPASLLHCLLMLSSTPAEWRCRSSTAATCPGRRRACPPGDRHFAAWLRIASIASCTGCVCSTMRHCEGGSRHIVPAATPSPQTAP